MNTERKRTGLLVGCGLIGLGLLSLLKGGFSHLGHFVSFSEYHVLFGIGVSVLGIYFLYTAFRKPKENINNQGDNSLKK